MTRVANVFTDPSTGQTYTWPTNHETEDPISKTRQISDGSSADNIGLIAQQGPATPLKLVWKGSILTSAHFQAMLAWWQVCEDHSIHVTDFSGATYEVLITDFAPQRVRVAQNRHDPSMYYNIYTYTLTMRVLSVVSGPWVGVTP